DEDDSRLAVSPRGFDYRIQNFRGIQLSNCFARTWIDQIVSFIVVDLPHELVSYGDRNIKGIQFQWICFSRNELFNIRMIDTEDCHVGAGAFSAKLGDFGSEVVQPHK